MRPHLRPPGRAGMEMGGGQVPSGLDKGVGTAAAGAPGRAGTAAAEAAQVCARRGGAPGARLLGLGRGAQAWAPGSPPRHRLGHGCPGER